MNLKARAARLTSDLPAVFLALGKREPPFPAKVFAALAVGYALSPIDLIPDFIPLLGYLDDVLILPVLVALSIRRIPPEILASCRVEAEGLWKNGAPRRWYYALPIVGIWLALSALMLWVILN